MSAQGQTPAARSTAQGVPVVVDTDYVADVSDTLLDVVRAGVLVTLAQNAQPGVTSLQILAEQAFDLTAGGLGGLAGDPVSVPQGSLLTAARGAASWLVSGLAAGFTPNITTAVSTGPIPTSAPAGDYLVELGGDGMPASPSSHTTKTGKVKVSVPVTLVSSSSGTGCGFHAIGIRDGSVTFGVELHMVSVDDSADGLGPYCNGTFVGVDEVDPGSTHTWGVEVQGFTNEGGGQNLSSVPTGGFASVTVEDT